MKIALALSGRFNNAENQNSGIEGFQYIKEILLDKYDVDVFVHSQELHNELLITELYQPVYSTFEIADINQAMIDNEIDQSYFDENFERRFTPFFNCSIASTLSMFYGRKRALNLVSIYSRKKKVHYDAVIIARFDLGQRDKNGNWEFYVSRMNFQPDLDMNKVWTAFWRQLNAGFADQWIFSSFENMMIVKDFYDLTIKAFKKDSKYEQLVVNGWPDSIHYDDQFNPNIKEQFTNEVFKEYNERSKNLMRYPKWQCVNNHILMKYLMIESGFYPNKLGFTVG